AVQQLASDDIERPGQIILFIRARRPDLLLSAFLHPLIANLGQQADVEFISKQQELSGAKMLKKPANPCQFKDALRVIIFRRKFSALPDPAELMQVTAHGFGRNFNAAIDFELGGKTGTRPTCATPAKGRGSRFEQRQPRACQPEGQGRGADRRMQWAIASEVKGERVVTVSSDNAIDRGARAEEESGNLGGRAARRTQQQDMQGQQVTVARLTKLRKHLLLLGLRNIEYGRVG